MRNEGVPDIVIQAMYARQTGDRLVLPTAPVSAASAATTTTPASAPLASAPVAVPTSAEVASAPAIANVPSPRVAKHNGTGEIRAFVEEGTYGLDKGSVGTFIGGGMQVNAGAHPTINGGMDFGLHKYVGLYGEGSYTLAYKANVGEFFGGGGVEVTGNNKSRIVPFARVGMDYGRLTLFNFGGMNIPALHLGCGFDAYVTKHFGVETQVSVLHTLGNYGGDNAGFVTFGLFYRTR